MADLRCPACHTLLVSGDQRCTCGPYNFHPWHGGGLLTSTLGLYTCMDEASFVAVPRSEPIRAAKACGCCCCDLLGRLFGEDGLLAGLTA